MALVYGADPAARGASLCQSPSDSYRLSRKRAVDRSARGVRVNVSFEDVVEAGARCLQQEGVEPSTAEAVVRHMATADLWGRHSHGLTTRFAAAVASARSGAGRRRPRVIDDAGARLVLDDTNGFGYGGVSWPPTTSSNAQETTHWPAWRCEIRHIRECWVFWPIVVREPVS
ncbi:MAG: hypothetical protein CME24_18365 [Gemmatimonadetes bacterium]|nr:hypothetical protein [Gemmatimonadota bacterium]